MKRISSVSSVLFVIAIVVTLAGGREASAIQALCCNQMNGACTTPPFPCDPGWVPWTGSCGNKDYCCVTRHGEDRCYSDVAAHCCDALGGTQLSSCDDCDEGGSSPTPEASEAVDAEEPVTWSEADEPEEADSELTPELSEDGDGDEAEKDDCEPADELPEDEWIMLLDQLIGAGR